jgi:sec-independent protein translocase protein TatC
MTILEHLEELRARIIKAGLAVIVGMVISAVWLSGRVLEWLIALGLGAGSGLQNINPPAVFFEYMKITVFAGVAIAMPVIIYQALMFVLPALTPQEKRYAFVIVPGSALCFVAGVAFGYYVLLPTALGFLQSFAGQYVATNWDISLFLGFVTTLLFWKGVAFQTPLVVFILVRLGVVSAARLGRYRKYALLVAFVIAAIITPTPDPITQTLVGVPLYLLYELGLLLARLVR